MEEIWTNTVDDETIKRCERGIVSRLNSLSSQEVSQLSDEELLEQEGGILDRLKDTPGFRYVIFPSDFYRGEDGFVCVNEVPDDFESYYRDLKSSVKAGGFGFKSRIRAVISVAEAAEAFCSTFGPYADIRDMDGVYADIRDGSLLIRADHWLKSTAEVRPEEEAVRALACITFQLICIDDPYDGKKALTLNPLLTKGAEEEIRSGKYEFIFADGDNQATGLSTKYAIPRWKALPGFARNIFIRCLSRGTDIDGGPVTLSEWLLFARRLADCLVEVNGRTQFCDPARKNKVRMLAAGEYKIPVWPGKELFWYHAQVPYQPKGAQIGYVDGKGDLVNCSGQIWKIASGDQLRDVTSGEAIRLKEGMTIRAGGEAELTVYDGGA